MPMFRSFVPRKMQPWIYLFIAVTFQLSGGVYLGALNQMIGSMSLMREDILCVCTPTWRAWQSTSRCCSV